MHKAIMQKLGFGHLVENVENGICPFCKNPVKDIPFRDSLSLKEFAISGLCQGCQDEFYNNCAENE